MSEHLVGSAAFKAVGAGVSRPAGSIPVHLRHEVVMFGGCGDGSGSERGFYGEDLPGCSFDYSDFDVPPECNLPSNWAIPDAGTLDAGPDAGTAPYECILAP